ncbi:FAD-dependent oxidoreductase [Reichenbachiella sp. MALMAid0571]|uniref:NAD(P)/FAD-dependent oxidoreductase n=1 Tax=Reichenbachiella sp. MALMAid0571 TaxID=3143939 RepID=UPI0032E00331
MIDYLIVGHGLAGAVLSQELLKAGKTVMVLDDPSISSASEVAAGLYNPVTGRKMVKTWNADKLFPEIEPFYSSLEKQINANFFHPIGIYRPFLSVEEQNEWQGKVATKEYIPYVERIFTSSRKEYLLHDEHGGLLLKNAGYVDTKVLINANKKFLMNKGNYLESMFKNHLLEEEVGYCRYEGLEFKKLIFCNGFNQQGNTWFDWLPFRPVKGEILRVEVENKIDTILNRGIFILPLNEKYCRIGSTYNWRKIDNLPSEEGKNEIEDKLKKLYKGNYKIADADAGIRPATKDRRPFMGLHPENEHIGIFNGFGSKGVSLIPFYAKNFVEYLEKGGELDAEVDVYRYFSLS